MFTLLITVIAVIVVSAIVLLTLHFTAGSAPSASQARHDATFLLEQGQRLVGAATQYRGRNNEWPSNLEQLVSGGFLAKLPAPSKGAWTMSVAGGPVFLLADAVTESVCREVNQVARGVDGIALKAYTGAGAQCYGASEGHLNVVVASSEADLLHALPAGHAAAGPAPSDPAAPGWFRAPSRARAVKPQAAPSPVAGEGRDGLTVEGVKISYTTLLMEQAEVFAPSVPRVQPVLENSTDAAVPVCFSSADNPEVVRFELGSCAEGVPAKGRCELSIVVNPGALGAYGGGAVLHVGETRQLAFKVTGEAVPPAAPAGSLEVGGVRASFTTADFGDATLGELVNGISLRLTNLRPQPVRLQEIAVSDEVDYTADYSSCLDNVREQGVLQSGESCSVELSFSPHATGSLPATLTIAFQGGQHIVRLVGIGKDLPAAAIEARADGFRLGDQPFSLGTQAEGVAGGGKFKPRALRIFNTGGQSLTFAGLALAAQDGVEGFSAAASRADELGGCERVSQLAPAEFCDVYVSYAVTNKAGTAKADLTVKFADQTGAAVQLKVPLVAKAYEGWLSLVEAESGLENVSSDAPGGWNFERVAVNSLATKRFILRNRGTASVVVRSIKLRPALPVDAPEGDTACVDGVELAAGEQCTVMVGFQPTEPNPQDAPSRLRVQVQTGAPTVRDDAQDKFVSPNTLEWTVRAWPTQ